MPVGDREANLHPGGSLVPVLAFSHARTERVPACNKTLPGSAPNRALSTNIARPKMDTLATMTSRQSRNKCSRIAGSCQKNSVSRFVALACLFLSWHIQDCVAASSKHLLRRALSSFASATETNGTNSFNSGSEFVIVDSREDDDALPPPRVILEPFVLQLAKTESIWPDAQLRFLLDTMETVVFDYVHNQTDTAHARALLRRGRQRRNRRELQSLGATNTSTSTSSSAASSLEYVKFGAAQQDYDFETETVALTLDTGVASFTAQPTPDAALVNGWVQIALSTQLVRQLQNVLTFSSVSAVTFAWQSDVEANANAAPPTTASSPSTVPPPAAAAVAVGAPTDTADTIAPPAAVVPVPPPVETGNGSTNQGTAAAAGDGNRSAESAENGGGGGANVPLITGTTIAAAAALILVLALAATTRRRSPTAEFKRAAALSNTEIEVRDDDSVRKTKQRQRSGGSKAPLVTATRSNGGGNGNGAGATDGRKASSIPKSLPKGLALPTAAAAAAAPGMDERSVADSESEWTVATEAGDTTTLKSIYPGTTTTNSLLKSTTSTASAPPNAATTTAHGGPDPIGLALSESFERDRQVAITKDMLTGQWSGRINNRNASGQQSESVLQPSHFSASQERRVRKAAKAQAAAAAAAAKVKTNSSSAGSGVPDRETSSISSREEASDNDSLVFEQANGGFWKNRGAASPSETSKRRTLLNRSPPPGGMCEL